MNVVAGIILCSWGVWALLEPCSSPLVWLGCREHAGLAQAERFWGTAGGAELSLQLAVGSLWDL